MRRAAPTEDGGCEAPEVHLQAGKVVLFTDGSSLGNPGPGGYGIVLRFGTARKELSGGFRRTTNNRMELMAAIAGLEALTRPSPVVLFSDSRYLVNGMTKGWALRWRRNHWMRTRIEQAENPDLWERLLHLCEKHQVTFCWLRGHAGHSENERCDQLAVAAASQPALPPDRGFEEPKQV